MTRRVPYDDLPLVPAAIAEVVCREPYSAQELSSRIGIPHASEVELRRRRMEEEDVRTFCDLADERCRAAYAARAEWFMRCVRARGNAGREQLYVWVRHWMASFLMSRQPLLPARSAALP